MNRQERLTELLEHINRHDDREYYFDDLYARLIAEYHIEWEYDSDFSTNHYLNNLRQTRDKQAATYTSAKKRRPVKGAPSEFRDFVSNFRHDVMNAMSLSK
jgi:hypothetical protein